MTQSRVGWFVELRDKGRIATAEQDTEEAKQFAELAAYWLPVGQYVDRAIFGADTSIRWAYYIGMASHNSTRALVAGLEHPGAVSVIKDVPILDLVPIDDEGRIIGPEGV